MARTVYFVSTHPDGGWQVKLAKGERAIKRHETKEQAIEHARGLAHSNEPSQVVVKRMDGTIETEWTYGDDPHPPAG